MVGTATDTLTKLRDGKLGLAQIQSLIPVAQGVTEATRIIADQFKAFVPAWSDLENTQVATYSETATKLLGAGTGLGLDIARRIVGRHSGALDFACMDAAADREPDHG